MMKSYILYEANNNVKQFVRCNENEIELYESLYIEVEFDDFHFDSSFTYKIENNEIIKSERVDSNYLLAKINQEFTNSVNNLTSSIPSSEIATWIKQESEAKAWLIDNNVSTPLIDAICTSRGVEKAYLVDKIILKADAYAVAIGTLTGERQKQEKLIKGEIAL